MAPHQNVSGAELHNLAAAANLSISTYAPPPPPSGLSSILESTTAPTSRFPRSHDHHHNHPLETSSFDEDEPGPNSYSMRPIPVSPGILGTKHTNPTHGPLPYVHIPTREPLQVCRPTTANSNNSSVH